MEYMNIFIDLCHEIIYHLDLQGHVGQLLPNDTTNVIINYIMELCKTIKEGRYDEGYIINMDETPLYLNMVPNKVISQKGCEHKIKKKLESHVYYQFVSMEISLDLEIMRRKNYPSILMQQPISNLISHGALVSFGELHLVQAMI